MRTPEMENPAPLAGGNRAEISKFDSPSSNPKAQTPQAAWRLRNPMATWAHRCLASALRRGLISKESCRDCGASEAEGHHANYHEPMRVEWLCRACHMALHKRLRRKGGAG